MQVDDIGIYNYERGADVRLDIASERSVTLSRMLNMGTSERREGWAWCSYSMINSVYATVFTGGVALAFMHQSFFLWTLTLALPQFIAEC